jgi:hypothetical protein
VSEREEGSRRLVEPVRADTVNPLNQDPADQPGHALGATGKPVTPPVNTGQAEEPAEADKFVEGMMPDFLPGDAILDDISEENHARKLAERFQPGNKADKT